MRDELPEVAAPELEGAVHVDGDQGAEGSAQSAPRSGLGIRQKIFILVLAAALIPALIVGTVSYSSARGILTEKVRTQFEARLAAAKADLQASVSQRVADTDIFANAFVVSRTLDLAAAGGRIDTQSLAKLERYLDEVSERYPLYRELVVLDRGGNPVARSADDGSIASGQRFRRRARGSGAVYFAQRGDEPVLAVHQGVRSSDGRVVGTLIAVVALDDLWRDLGAVVGESRERLVLLDSKGSPLFDSAEAEGSRVPARVMDSDPGVFEYKDGEGREILAAFGSVPAYELGILLELDSSVAFMAVSRLRTVVTLISLFAAILIIGLGAVFAVNLTRPIGALIEGARKAADGDLSAEIPVTSADEVGELTTTFNRMVRSLHRSQERLEVLSVTDELTGLYNRRYLIRALDRELKRAQRSGGVFAVIMIDLDRFKAFNDDRGHFEGDSFLREAAAMLESEFRPTDVVARYGGEEFVILLPEAGKAQAGAVAERVRLRFAEHAQSLEDTPRVTISAGVASYPEDGSTRTELIVNADMALYQAKRLGRNRVEICKAA